MIALRLLLTLFIAFNCLKFHALLFSGWYKILSCSLLTELMFWNINCDCGVYKQVFKCNLECQTIIYFWDEKNCIYYILNFFLKITFICVRIWVFFHCNLIFKFQIFWYIFCIIVFKISYFISHWIISSVLHPFYKEYK